jgi:hypothetical protein
MVLPKCLPSTYYQSTTATRVPRTGKLARTLNRLLAYDLEQPLNRFLWLKSWPEAYNSTREIDFVDARVKKNDHYPFLLEISRQAYANTVNGSFWSTISLEATRRIVAHAAHPRRHNTNFGILGCQYVW